MQGSNNGRIKMARQKFKFDDADWGGQFGKGQTQRKKGHASKVVRTEKNSNQFKSRE